MRHLKRVKKNIPTRKENMGNRNNEKKKKYIELDIEEINKTKTFQWLGHLKRKKKKTRIYTQRTYDKQITGKKKKEVKEEEEDKTDN